MNEYDVKRLAEIYAIQAQIEGMKSENEQLSQYGRSLKYMYKDFWLKAQELREAASKHNDQF